MSAPEIPESETGRRTQGPGQSLRAAREAQQLGIDKVAAQLHLSPSMVEAIERDDFGRLPGAVFVRGYLKNYARLVGLSAEHILAAYEVHGPDEEIATPVVKTSIKDEVSSGHAGVRLVTWAITLALVALLAVWWWGYLDWPPPPAEPERVDEVPGIDQAGPQPPGFPAIEPPPEEPLAPGPVAVEPAAPAVDVEPLPEPLAEPGPAPEPEPVAEPAEAGAETEAAPPAGDDRVVFEFNAACWVDIRDASGRFKLFGEMEKGERHVAEGVPPWSVVLGNSRAVDITVGGEPFDHSRFASGNVARFKLDPGNL
jgi:cytoskeleton protein RodZ